MTKTNTKRIGGGCIDDGNGGGDAGGGGKETAMLCHSQHKRCIDDPDANKNSSQRKGSKRTCIGCDQIVNDIGEFVKRESPRGNTARILTTSDSKHGYNNNCAIVIGGNINRESGEITLATTHHNK